MIFLLAAVLLYAEGAVAASSGTADSSTTTRSRSGPPPAARQDTFMGTGNAGTGGFSGTYTDPETGDIVTRVVPPADPNISQTPPVPIYIYPQVEPQWPPANNRPRPEPRQGGNPSLYRPYGN